jgi:hypothetical protein
MAKPGCIQPHLCLPALQSGQGGTAVSPRRVRVTLAPVAPAGANLDQANPVAVQLFLGHAGRSRQKTNAAVKCDCGDSCGLKRERLHSVGLVHV